MIPLFLVPGLLGILLLAPPALAVSAHVSVAYGRGGSHLSDATGGQGYDTQAGSGMMLSLGMLVPVSPLEPHRTEIQLGVGYLSQGYGRKGEDKVWWTRVPLDAIYYYRNMKDLFRAGWGFTYHVANQIEAEGMNASAARSVHPALGWVVAAEKLFAYSNGANAHWGVGVKYVMIKYRVTGAREDVDGNCVYLTLSSLGY